MDDVIEENMNRHSLPEQREMARKYRNIGLGVMGYADMLIKLGITYGSQEAKDFTRTLFRTLFRKAVISSVDLAKERGPFPEYKPEVFDSEIICNHFTEEERAEFKIYGIRNASILSIAPTGSISTMLNISGGIEPVFAFEHYRQTENINGGEKYKVYAEIAQEYFNMNPDADELPKYFVSSYDINWKDRIDIQAIIQDSIDTAISSTINLPKDIKLEEIHDFYIKAWQAGLKGITIYRDGSRIGILTTIDDSQTINHKVKRPESIPCDIHNVKINGEQWTIIIGLLNKIPYEVFAFKNRNIHIIDVDDSKLLKQNINGKNYYSIISNNVNIIDLPQLYETGEEEFITRLISRLVRLGEIKTVLKDAEKTYKNIGTFVNVIRRILAKYIPEEYTEEICPKCGQNAIITEGCIKCPCGFIDKCG